MLVEVTRLRRAGQRLKPSELDSPVRGELRVADDEGRSSFKRVMRVATLHRPFDPAWPMMQDVMTPLFGADLLLIEANTITISGIELSADPDRRVVETAQVWRCTIVAAAASHEPEMN